MTFQYANDAGDICEALTKDVESLDIEIGSETTNTFQAVCQASDYNKKGIRKVKYIYCHGTEYGGRVRYITSDTGAKMVKIFGDTFRGILAKMVIEPPAGYSYRVVSGDLSTVTADLLSLFGDSLFVADKSLTGIVIPSTNIGYQSVLDTLDEIYSEHNMSLKLEADGLGDMLKVTVGAVPIVDLSDDIEISQDGFLTFKVSTAVSPNYKYMICAGKGELKDRVIRYLYWNNGKPIEIESIPKGTDITTYFYDYANAEDTKKLLAGGKKKFIEINSVPSVECNLNETMQDVALGSIVGGRDYITGIYTSKPIVSKIVKATRKLQKISYKAGD